MNSTIAPISSAKPALLRVRDLRKTFVDSGAPIEVIKGACLELQHGEHIAITGQSGSGKSTFLNLICALEARDSGTVEWDGEPILNRDPKRLATMRGQFFGFIFQSFYLIPELNAFENVLIAARLLRRVDRACRSRAQHLLEVVGLEDRLKHPVQKLSGGERQRVAIARALMNQPSVILADEPTGNLDESTAGEVIRLIFEVCRDNQSSLLLVTHNPEFAKLTDRQFLLHDGLIHPA